MSQNIHHSEWVCSVIFRDFTPSSSWEVHTEWYFDLLVGSWNTNVYVFKRNSDKHQKNCQNFSVTVVLHRGVLSVSLLTTLGTKLHKMNTKYPWILAAVRPTTSPRLPALGGNVEACDHHDVGLAEVDPALQPRRDNLQGFQAIQRVHLKRLPRVNFTNTTWDSCF